jgi:hypothetical protein
MLPSKPDPKNVGYSNSNGFSFIGPDIETESNKLLTRMVFAEVPAAG